MALVPRYTRKNILTGMAQIWIQPFDPSTAATLPQGTLPLGEDWSTANPDWTALGASESGATMRFTRETNDITIEEQVNPVDVKTQTLDPRIEITLAESTLDTMRITYGGGEITEQTAGSTNPGTRDLVISETLEHFVIGMEGMNQDGFFRRVLMPDVLSIAEVETSFRRAETQQLYAASFRMVSPVGDMVVHEKTAEPTG